MISSPDIRSLHADAQAAAAAAYDTLAANRNRTPDEMHRLKVCYEASDLIVDSLVIRGYQATHVVHNGPATGEHSYVTVDEGLNTVVIDATWQQFLPVLQPAAPKVLIGSRAELTQKAKEYGVAAANDLWDEAQTMPLAQQKAQDRAAEQVANNAAEAGRWEAFMRGSGAA